MNCYKVEFECTNYNKESVRGDNNSYLNVQNGTLFVLAEDLKEVQSLLMNYKNNIISCVKIGLGLKK